MAIAIAGCGSPPTGIAPTDAATVDAVPDAVPDAALRELGQSLVFDSIELTGANLIFRLLGTQLLNDQINQQIQAGSFLLVIELRDLDDPSGQDDPTVTVGFYTGTDTDDDPTDNFNADDPERLIAAPLTIGGDGTPLVSFGDGSIASGRLTASGNGVFPLPGSIPIPLQDAVLSGDLVSATDGSHIRLLENASLSGSVPMSALGLIPNLLGSMCPGSTLLDVMISGCGTGFAVQPDVDLDGDGLEKLYDTPMPNDAGVTADGTIDRCVDGDGTEILGTSCWNDPAMADGYRMVFTVHGTRVLLLAAP